MGKGFLPPETTLDDVKVRIRQTYSNPNVGKIQQVILRDGPVTFKIATLLEIKDAAGNFHHYSLKIDCINHRKAGWFAKAERSVRLEGGEPDEIEHLYRFLTALTGGKLTHRTGELHIIGADEYVKLEKLLDALPNLASADKLQLVRTILSQIEESASYVEEFVEAFKSSNPETLRHIAVASRFVEYSAAYDRLAELVDADDTPEGDLQKHLQDNPWMFGSEYSELLDRRRWTRDDQLDFMLRRTVDNFLEIVEIKTPAKEPLLLHDGSHNSYYPSSKLSVALGQAMRYIEEVERDRNSIQSKDGYDTLKIRARVIFGRDGDVQHQTALRNLNAHLHRIEVITFDQLLRIARRVLAVFEGKAEDSEPDGNHFVEDDSIPF